MLSKNKLMALTLSKLVMWIFVFVVLLFTPVFTWKSLLFVAVALSIGLEMVVAVMIYKSYEDGEQP
jgi:hypothetical protein